jgi:hypothetical protein
MELPEPRLEACFRLPIVTGTMSKHCWLSDEQMDR